MICLNPNIVVMTAFQAPFLSPSSLCVLWAGWLGSQGERSLRESSILSGGPSRLDVEGKVGGRFWLSHGIRMLELVEDFNLI